MYKGIWRDLAFGIVIGMIIGTAIVITVRLACG